MRIIPSIDIYQNRCVRLKQGDFSARTDYELEPSAMAGQLVHSGARHLHIVDLEGAKAGRIVNWHSIEKIRRIQEITIQAGGGVRTAEDVDRMLQSGVNRVVIGSVALRSPETLKLWIGRHGADAFCVAIDIKDGQAAYQGWQELDQSDLSGVIARLVDIGVSRFLSTDIRRDGMMQGPNLELYRTLIGEFPAVEWLASGGVRSKEDVRDLENVGVAGVIIGKALHEGAMDLRDLC
mgnify:CR=1 FL=1